MGLILPAHIAEEQKRTQARCDWLERQVVEIIKKHYKGHMFTVNVVAAPDMREASILIDHVSMGEAHAKYHCTATDMYDTQGKIIVQLAGEILERMNIPRVCVQDYDKYVDLYSFDKREAKEAFSCR